MSKNSEDIRLRSERVGRTGEQGFTLVEMLVVITIIGLIMGLIGPRVLNYLSESKVKAAKIQMQSFASALDLFNLDAGRYPSSAEGLAALVRPTPGVAAWNGPYLKGGAVPNDPWSHPYIDRADTAGPDLRDTRQLAHRKDRNCLPRAICQLTGVMPASRSWKS